MKNICIALLLLLFSYVSAQQKTQFSLLESAHTGVTFDNRIVDSKDQNILLYANFYGGAGVGVGDFNNDGLIDVYFAGNLVADELYFNQGDFKFKNVTKEAGITDDGNWSTGVSVEGGGTVSGV